MLACGLGASGLPGMPCTHPPDAHCWIFAALFTSTGGGAGADQRLDARGAGVPAGRGAAQVQCGSGSRFSCQAEAWLFFVHCSVCQISSSSSSSSICHSSPGLNGLRSQSCSGLCLFHHMHALPPSPTAFWPLLPAPAVGCAHPSAAARCRTWRSACCRSAGGCCVCVGQRGGGHTSMALVGAAFVRLSFLCMNAASRRLASLLSTEFRAELTNMSALSIPMLPPGAGRSGAASRRLTVPPFTQI